MAADPGWLVTFDAAELAELEAALRVFRAGGRPLAAMTRADFPLPRLSATLARHLAELRDGRGFVVLRGLPVGRYADDEVGAIFYGLGLHLGQPLRQNPRGDLLGHVHDEGKAFGAMTVRGSQTNAFLPFHTDSCELIGLLCLRAAKAGGLSSNSSAVAVYRELERSAPELLPVLGRGYRYIRREIAEGDSPVTEAPVPVFGERDGVVSCRFVPTQIEAAAARIGRPIAGRDRAALDRLNALAADDRFRLDMDLRPGDIQLLNNYVVLHSRTGYEDHPEPARKRHMLRLWLAFEEPWPLAPGFGRRLGYAGDRVIENAA